MEILLWSKRQKTKTETSWDKFPSSFLILFQALTLNYSTFFQLGSFRRFMNFESVKREDLF